MNDDLLDESLLDDTPPPKLEAAPRVITGTPHTSGDVSMPPPLNVELLQEIPPEAPPPLALDALREVPADAPPLVLGEDALQELPPTAMQVVMGAVEPAPLPLEALQEVPDANDGFSYDTCPKCSTPKGTGALCDTCGTRLVFKAKKKAAPDPDSKKRCRECGTANKVTRLRCLNCGGRMPSDA